MRVTAIDSTSQTKFAIRRPTPKSFSDLVEALSKKAEVKRSY